MIPREIADKIRAWASQYPVITITGPRQSGKSTLSKALFPTLPYLSLEDPHTRRAAIEDPRGFLARLPDGAVLDEFQRVPDLPSYIQGIVDESKRTGMFILTGSSQFELMKGLSQSLAGRTAIARLLPFSYSEVYGTGEGPGLDMILHKGFFPRIHDKGLDPTEAMAFYLSTYLERDIRSLINVRDISLFETFLRLLAGRSGQLLNASSLAADCGLSHNTITAWISVLEQSAIVHLLRPWHGNIGKRLLKTPKVYVLDTGLLCYLLGILTPQQLSSHPLRGQVFESFVMAELLKSSYNRGRAGSFSFFRDQAGHEVDFILEGGRGRTAVEAKSSATFHPEFTKTIDWLAPVLGEDTKKAVILGNVDAPYGFKDAEIRGFPFISGLDGV